MMIAERGAAMRGPSHRHRIPAIDRAARVLAAVARRPSGMSISDLTAMLRLPRTSVYRVVNSLAAHEILQRVDGKGYALGPRLLALAAQVQTRDVGTNLASLAQPFLERLSAETGEATKISVLSGDHALVIGAVSGNREYALTAAVGQRLPLHAGAAGKVLLAWLDADQCDAILGRPLISQTPHTLIDRRRLITEFARIRRLGWAQDVGEFIVGVHAFAAPIHDRRRRVIGALSLPFLAHSKPPQHQRLREAVQRYATAISTAAQRSP